VRKSRPGNRLPHHKQHFAVEPVGLCDKLFQITVFNDVAVFDDAHPFFLNLRSSPYHRSGILRSFHMLAPSPHTFARQLGHSGSHARIESELFGT
jgi:hypothetical protein